MTTHPVPVALRGPNVAQVRPMVHSPAHSAVTAVPQTALTSLQTSIAVGDKGGVKPALSLQSAPVPPGRYKYTTGNIAGHQGIYLVPLSQEPGTKDPAVFVPFSPTNSPLVSNLIPPQPQNSVHSTQNTSIATGALQLNNNLATGTPQPNTNLTTGTPQPIIILQTPNVSQANVSTTTQALGLPTMNTTAGNTVRPGSVIYKNVASSMNTVNQLQGVIPATQTVSQATYSLQNRGASVSTAGSTRTLLVKVQGKKGDHNYNQLLGQPGQPLMLPGQKLGNHMYSQLMPVQHTQQVMRHPIIAPTAPKERMITTLYPAVSASLRPGLPQTANLLVNTSSPTISSNVTAATGQLRTDLVNPPMSIDTTNQTVSSGVTVDIPITGQSATDIVNLPKSTDTLFIPKPGSVSPEISDESPPVLLPQNSGYPGENTEESWDSSTESADSPDKVIVKQEQEDTQGEEEPPGFQFKIDSVFSLSSVSETDAESPKKEPVAETGCRYNDTHFVVLQNLDLKGLRCVDVRKFRKLTGRQSCNKKCRERTVIRLCRNKNLHLKVKEESKPKLLQESQIKMDKEELEDFEIFSARCRPAPRAHKLKLFRFAGRKIKFNFPQVKPRKKPPLMKMEERAKLTGSQKPAVTNYLMSDGKLVAQEINLTSSTEHEYANKAVSLLNPESKPIQGWIPLGTSSGSATTTPTAASNTSLTTNVDPMSPAPLKTTPPSGTKKFYLIKVDGKNILIPVEQSGIQPRAYVLGSDTSGASVTAAAQNIVSGNFPTVNPSQIKAPNPTSVVKPTPKVTPSKTPSTKVRVKTEPIDTGYEKSTQKTTIQPLPSVSQVQIKSEPMRGYADEEPMKTASPQPESASSSAAEAPSKNIRPPPIMDNTDKAPKMNPFPAKSSQSLSSADRIRKLKELLKENEEELERIKKKRKEEAGELSSVLSDEDL